METPKYQVFSPAKTQNLLWKAGKPNDHIFGEREQLTCPQWSYQFPS